jgi:hypothetical protein
MKEPVHETYKVRERERKGEGGGVNLVKYS